MTILSICLNCKRFLRVVEEHLTCEVYLDGILDDIFFEIEEGEVCKMGYQFERHLGAGDV